MSALSSLVAVLLLAAIAWGGSQVGPLRPVIGVAVPFAAMAVFLAGLAWRVVTWAGSPVPFRITTTAGQQRSLPWIKASRLDCPSTTLGAIGRMALEVLLFRSLFRNTRAELRPGPRLVFGENKRLWLGAIAFHYSLLVVLARHLRFFTEPVPGVVNAIAGADGFFRVASPVLYATDVVILAALAYLLGRRLWNPQVRYISLFTDYLALFLLLGLAGSGVLMRYVWRVDVVAAKQFALGLVTFTPVVPESVGPLFFVHLLILSALAAYFPFSKLTHMAGILLSPTRNLANTSRMKRHINVWDCRVKVHTYEEWEEEFRDKLKAAGLPLQKG